MFSEDTMFELDTIDLWGKPLLTRALGLHLMEWNVNYTCLINIPIHQK